LSPSILHFFLATRARQPWLGASVALQGPRVWGAWRERVGGSAASASFSTAQGRAAGMQCKQGSCWQPVRHALLMAGRPPRPCVNKCTDPLPTPALQSAAHALARLPAGNKPAQSRNQQTRRPPPDTEQLARTAGQDSPAPMHSRLQQRLSCAHAQAPQTLAPSAQHPPGSRRACMQSSGVM
jgi:hypothetical protein